MNMLATLIVSLVCFAQPEAYQYKISGTANDLPNHSKIYLKFLTAAKSPESTMVENGSFEFSGSLPDSLVKVILKTEDGKESTAFWVGSAHTTMELGGFELITKIISGSRIQQDLELLNTALSKMDAEKSELLKIRETKTLERDRYDFSNYVAEIEKDQRNEITTFVVNHRNSIVTADMLLTNAGLFTKTSIDGIAFRDLFTMLSADVKRSALGVQLFEKAFNKTNNIKIGDHFIDFELPDTTGNMIKLSNIKSDLILLEFWGSGCGPCRVENPNLFNLYRQYKKQGLEIISVSLDRSRANWVAAIKKDKLSWLQVCNFKIRNDAVIKYDVVGIPDNFLINKYGIIVGKNLRGDELRNKIAELIEE